MSKPYGGCKQYSRNKNECLETGCTWCPGNKKFKKCRWKPGYFACSGKIPQRGLAGENAVGNRYKNYVNNSEKKENTATKLTFPGFIIQTIYEKLFNTRTEEGKTTDSAATLKISGVPSCFEDGAFLFEDKYGALFNILAYGDASDTSGANRSAKPSGRNTLSQLYKPLTHLMPYLEPFENKNKLQDLLRRKLEIGEGVERITFTFHNLSGREPEITLLTYKNIDPTEWLKVNQYERVIGNPKIKIDCGYDNGETTKGVIKFYSYSINVLYGGVSGRKNRTVTKRFTYVKLESESMKGVQGHGHHIIRNLEKKFPKTKPKTGENQQPLLSSTSTSPVGCYQKRNKNTCYRAEDVVVRPDEREYEAWVQTYNPGEEKYYQDYRVGAEYLVPQQKTREIINDITQSNLRFARIINPAVMPREHMRTGFSTGGGKRKTRKRRKKKTRRKKRNRKKRTRKR